MDALEGSRQVSLDLVIEGDFLIEIHIVVCQKGRIVLF